MAVGAALTPALRAEVLVLEDDLRARIEAQPDVLAQWRSEHEAAVDRERTAMSWVAWRDDRVTQAAVAWVLTTVFVRFCEDNRLLAPVWIAGPPQRRQEALDAELAYFRGHPEQTDREWLLQAVEHLRSVRATRELVESHSPLWTVSPSGQAVQRLNSFWRQSTETGSLVWDFTDPQLSTRFLGDLYQDLSDYAKKTYALLQTPEFVEEFILDQTMEPALAERPLDGFRMIDPTCGSGHFLLGAFARLVDRWSRQAPGLEPRARVQQALDAVHGVDLNPFAVAIARFRLMVAALQACGETSLEDAPGFTFHLAAGDSLLHGGHQLTLPYDGYDPDSALSGFAYTTEDLAALREILTPGRYDVVVGNPPYITVKDKKLNAAYRHLYTSCKGTYAMTVPFMERFFQFAKPSVGDQPAGWAGQIISNSFMKREFGSKLIEEFLAQQDLRLVVDTSGAYIPGHGTPTVIVVGRPQRPVGATVRAVLGVRGEPGQPADPAKGLVWSSISDHVEEPGFDNDYISVVELDRSDLTGHPWSLGGGGAAALLGHIAQASNRELAGIIKGPIGGAIRAGSDEAFMRPMDWRPRTPTVAQRLRPLVQGDIVRDWRLTPDAQILFPYSYSEGTPLDAGLSVELWPWRTMLARRSTFQGQMADAGLHWWEYMQFTKSPYATPLSIAFAFVATHNHFVLDRGGKVFKQTAPVIKLPSSATEVDHLALLGILNSSTACFWLKQNCQSKPHIDEVWATRFEFNGTTVADFPLPHPLPVKRAQLLEDRARNIGHRFRTRAVSSDGVPSASVLAAVEAQTMTDRRAMTAVQEELDWEVYRMYGLIDEDLTLLSEPPGIALGERAFEIALARKVAAGDEQTAWFTRHGSTPVTDVPQHWPEDYRALVQRRLEVIESNPFIRLLERPEYKRRWAAEPWEQQVDRALRSWLLDRLEDRRYWFDGQGRPTAQSVGQLADTVARDAELVSVLELWSGRRDQPVATTLTSLLETESVPYLASYRLKDSGLRKREVWEQTWDLQRREDAGQSVGDIPVPPKYTSADFRRQSWWQHRGKLDVPKERFILYPDAGRATDPTPLLGWAGWDHAQQALALAAVLGQREAEGWEDKRLVSLVAGLAELQPWVRQWHDEPDERFAGVNLADYLQEELRGRAAQVGRTLDELRSWRPPETARGRRRTVNA